MNHFYSPQPSETISVVVESSPVWEVILGIAGYTHAQLRHTFDQHEQWTAARGSMPSSFVSQLQEVEQNNLWYGLIMVQNKLSAYSVRDFSHRLNNLSADGLYETLLPYKDRDSEPIRKAIASQSDRKESIEKYAALFEGHDYLSGYVRCLARYSPPKICELFHQIVTEWHDWVSRQKDWEKWTQALAFEQKLHSSLDQNRPIEEIERITGGVKYLPEPSIWEIKLVPHVSYRPWTLAKRTADTKLFFYPLREDYWLEPGVPSTELVRGHKALGDELRLKLLYQLQKGPLSLQELSVMFQISKTTLHHQLSLLKAAKFIHVEKGIYSANLAQIHSFSDRLAHYLGDIQ
ncbi:ArsR/SmtB family transcription factor [Brevibacillus sp. GCM10020057]|uniref:ArsR/SmtB family transcription factor n=1 Tax=Brevibacillus sp. GCM10020057 TaxID=3317327 RepID=UPI00362C8119